MKKTTFFISLLLMLNTSIFAEIKLPAIFCNHMVLQRGVEIPVWGTARPGENLSFTFRNFKLKIKVRETGEWLVNLPVQKAGGPYKLEIWGDNKIELNDIYVGDVWLCSGQSNMDMTVAKEDRYWCGVLNETEEVANANFPMIRFFDVDFTPSHSIKTMLPANGKSVRHKL